MNVQIKSLIDAVIAETKPSGNTKERIGNLLNALNNLKADTATTFTKSEVTDMINEVKLLATSGSVFYGSITPASTIPPADNLWGFAEAGTYPNAGGIVVPANNFAVLSKSGSSWTSVKVAMPQANQNIADFASLTFPAAAKTQTIYLNKYWRVKTGQTAAVTDLPSTDPTSKWELISEAKADTILIPGKQIFNKANAKSGVVALANGNITASVNWVNTDFIDILGSTTYTGKGFNVSASSTGTALFAFYDVNKVFISGVASTGAVTQTATSPATARFMKLSLANVTNVGVTPTNNAVVNSFMLVQGTTVGGYEAYNTYFIDKSSLLDKYPKFMVELIPYTADYANVLIDVVIARVYERVEGDIYMMHLLRYNKLAYADYVSGDFVGGEVVRYAGTGLYQYDINSNVFNATSVQLVTTNESEFVMSPGGWAGGYHGNEFLQSVYFLIDGKAYNTNGTVNFTAPPSLIKCGSFAYVQKSVINKATVDHTPLCNRVKHFTAKNGYKVRTKFKNIAAMSNVLMYPGISCIGKYFTSVTLDSGNYALPVGGNAFIINNDAMARKATYGGAAYQITANCTIFKSSYDDLADVLIWDRATDTKYYRRISSMNLVIGETFESETEVVLTSLS